MWNNSVKRLKQTPELQASQCSLSDGTTFQPWAMPEPGKAILSQSSAVDLRPFHTGNTIIMSCSREREIDLLQLHIPRDKDSLILEALIRHKHGDVGRFIRYDSDVWESSRPLWNLVWQVKFVARASTWSTSWFPLLEQLMTSNHIERRIPSQTYLAVFVLFAGKIYACVFSIFL